MSYAEYLGSACRHCIRVVVCLFDCSKNMVAEIYEFLFESLMYLGQLLESIMIFLVHQQQKKYI